MIGRRGSTLANRARNRLRDEGRAERWAPARDACWQALDPLVSPDARVLVVGAGHGDDLPLTRLTQRCGELTLADLDAGAVRRARARIEPALRCRVRVLRREITGGAADRIVAWVLAGAVDPAPTACKVGPVAGGGYDVVVGDLFYSQLLYPALLDARVPTTRLRRVLERSGPPLTDVAVARLQASVAPGGSVVHLHDAAGWWKGHPQPHSVASVLALPDRLADCRGPLGAEPRASLSRGGLVPVHEALWEWPFAPGTSYVVRATVVAA